jgi:hypothetical protein
LLTVNEKVIGAIVNSDRSYKLDRGEQRDFNGPDKPDAGPGDAEGGSAAAALTVPVPEAD